LKGKTTKGVRERKKCPTQRRKEKEKRDKSNQREGFLTKPRKKQGTCGFGIWVIARAEVKESEGSDKKKTTKWEEKTYFSTGASS